MRTATIARYPLFVRVERIHRATAELATAFTRLIPQLAPHRVYPSVRWLEHLVTTAVVFVAWDVRGVIVGVATLNLATATATHARIDDVVVAPDVRGCGFDLALCQAAIAHAQAEGASAVYLTTRRLADADLYERLGFTRLDRNCSRLALDQSSS